MSTSQQERHKVVKRAFFMSSGTFISRVLGLFRDVAVGAFFSRTQTDIFFVAFRIPNFFRKFLGEGALSISFIPVFVHLLSSPPSAEEKAKNFMNSVYTLLLVVVGILVVVGVLMMEYVFYAMFEGSAFSQVEGKLDTVILLSRLMFVYLFLVTLYAYFMGVCNALGRFFVPALAPAVLNAFVIAFAFLPPSWVPVPSMLLCFGVLVGGFFQMILTAFALGRMGFFPKFRFCFFTPELKLFYSRFFPGLLGVGGLSLVGMLNLYFAGWLPEGTHTFIYYGDRLLELPRSLIAVSLGTALLTSLSQMVAKGKQFKVSDKAAENLDMLLFLTLPCAVVFVFGGEYVVGLLFQRGFFDEAAVLQTAVVVKIHSALLVLSSVTYVLSTAFYAVKNTWYPALCVCLYVLFHALWTPYMVRGFDLPGLVWATVLSHLFFMALLLLAYPFCVGPLYVWRTLKKVFALLPGLLCMAVVFHWGLGFFTEGLKNNFWLYLCGFLFLLAFAFAWYLCVCWWLKLSEALVFFNAFKRKLFYKFNE